MVSPLEYSMVLASVHKLEDNWAKMMVKEFEVTWE